MKLKFCFLISKVNFLKNSRCFIPFMIACISTMFTYLVYVSVAYNTSLDVIPVNSSFVQSFFKVGKVVIIIFSIIFLLYANSYIFKSRIKEFGLYSLMGLEKKHIVLVSFFEQLFCFSISFVAATVLAIIFGKLFFMFFSYIMNLNIANQYHISGSAFFDTGRFFIIVFFIVYLANAIKIYKTTTIQLLKSENVSEKEPKNNRIIGLIGIILLLIGYIYALTAQFIVDLVVIVPVIILGTYLFFLSSCTMILKNIMKNKKKFYAKRYFISVTNLLFRIKKNALSLASINILCTSVIMVLTIAASVFLGRNDMLHNRFQYDLQFTGKSVNHYVDLVNQTAKDYNVAVENQHVYTSTLVRADIIDEQLKESTTTKAKTYSVYLVPFNDYLAAGGEDIKNTVLILDLSDRLNLKNISVEQNSYHVKMVNRLPFAKKGTQKVKEVIMVVPDVELFSSIFKKVTLEQNAVFDLSGSNLNKIQFGQSIYKVKNKNKNLTLCSSYSVEEATWYSYFGGGIFICVFLGILFILFFVLIMYFKQITEGSEDKHQFVILEKVGLSEKETYDTIRTQTKIIFFIPIMMAAIHMIMAFNVICRALEAFYLGNRLIIALCLGIILLIFLGIYYIVYKITSRIYWKIIRGI